MPSTPSVVLTRCSPFSSACSATAATASATIFARSARAVSASIAPASSWVSSKRSSTNSESWRHRAPHLARVSLQARRVGDHTVVDRLHHRPQRGQRRPQVVAHGRHQVAAHRLGLTFPRWAACSSDAMSSRVAPSVSSSGPASSRPTRVVEVALAERRAASVEPGRRPPRKSGDHERPGDPGGGRVEEQHGDEGRVVLADRHPEVSTPRLATRSRPRAATADESRRIERAPQEPCEHGRDA